MSRKTQGDDTLDKLQRDRLDYVLKETSPRNGLVPDSTRKDARSSIAAGGLALAAYVVGAERTFITRATLAPSLTACKQGVGMTRRRGTCVLVRQPTGEFPVPVFDLVATCTTIRGSFVGTRQDMVVALAVAAERKVKAGIELQPLSSINRVHDRLEHGEVASRVVLESENWSTKWMSTAPFGRFANPMRSDVRGCDTLG